MAPRLPFGLTTRGDVERIIQERGLMTPERVTDIVRANVKAIEASTVSEITEALYNEWREPFFDSWYRKGNGRPNDQERIKAIEQSRKQFWQDPMIWRAWKVYETFVFGRGVGRPRLSKDYLDSLSDGEEPGVDGQAPEVEQTPAEVVQFETLLADVWDDPYAQAQLFGTQGQRNSYMRLMQDGMLPIVIFQNAEVNNRFSLGVLDGYQLRDYIEHPTMPGVFLAYKRDWLGRNGERKVKWFWTTDCQNNPALRARVQFQADAESLPDENAWLYMVKVGPDPASPYGFPPFYSALAPARSAVETVGNMRTWLRAKVRFAWRQVTPGAAGYMLDAQKSAEETKIDRSQPRPPTGSTVIENSASKLDPIEITDGGAKLFTDTLNSCKLLICAATGIPLHYFGDVSAGKLTTADSVELALLKLFESEQQSIVGMWDGIIRTVAKMAGYEFDTERLIDVDFPTIDAADAVGMLGALSQAYTAGVVSLPDAGRVAAQHLGADEPDEWVERLESEGEKGETMTELNQMIESGDERQLMRAASITLAFNRRVQAKVKAVEAGKR